LKDKLEEMRTEDNLDMVIKIEEAIKTHEGNLETLEMNNAQAIKNLAGVEEIVDYLLSLKEEI
jgi:hypothetical protein